MDKKAILNHKIKLNNNVEIPQFGLGTYLMKDRNEIYNAVTVALENGYRHIDTAQFYDNEVVIGQALKDFLSKHPEVTRKDIFITSKIWNTSHPYQLAKDAFMEILKRLQLDYLDLCLIHWPTKYRFECWKALEEMYALGKVKAIGVSNFKVHHLKEFLKKVKVKPTVNQIETHPGFNQLDVVEYCQKVGIAITSWRTMMAGATKDIPLLVELAKKYNTTSSHVALRWAWQLNEIIIPKSVTPTRIINNPEIGNFQLSPEEMAAINKLPQKRLGPDPDDKKIWKDMID